MCIRYILFGLALVGLLPLAAIGADLPATVARIKPSIVAVGTLVRTRQPPAQFKGTGFVVGKGRHVITNAHVLPARLDKAKKEVLTVISGRGRGRVHRATLVGKDDRHDLALLAIADGPLPAMSLGKVAGVREGKLYAFTGYPIGPVLGLFSVTHRGIVSAISPVAIPQVSARTLNPETMRRLGNPYDVFQLDATAYPGNSGSPLYDVATGAVVGVINKVFVKQSKENVLSKPSGITYAIPVNHVRALMKKHGVSP